MKVNYAILCCTIAISCCGCATIKRGKDNYQYQPIVAPPGKVKGILENKPNGLIDMGKLTYTKSVNWQINTFKKYNSENVINECVRFLNSKNCSVDVAVIPRESLPNDDRYPWLWYKNAKYYSMAVLYDKEGNFISQKRQVYYRNNGYNKIKTIVCLEPVVVVNINGSIIRLNNSEFLFPSDDVLPFRLFSNRVGDFVFLKDGFAYGTRMPYASHPQWFSPDMNVTPRPVEIGTDGKGRIKVPWGYLILTKQDDEWVVTAEAKK